jgi:predicted permease
VNALRRFVKRLRASLPGDDDGERVREELSEHLRLLTEEYARKGFTMDEARRLAMLKLGAGEPTTEAWRDEQRLRPLEDAWRDARLAVRQAVFAPVFTLAVVGSLVLGLGATVTIYTVMRAALWRPADGVVRPEQIVHLVRTTPNDPARTELTSSYALFQELREAASPAATRVVAKATAGRHKFGVTPESRERVTGEAVSDEFFAVLGVSPIAGRLFVSGDDRPTGGDRVVVLSHRFWTARFQGDPNVVGRAVYYDEVPFTILGVAAERFEGIDAERSIDVWIPITADPAIPPDRLRKPSSFWLTMLARVSPETSTAAVQSTLNQRFRAHLEAHVLPGLPARFADVFANQQLQIRPAPAGLSTTGRQYELQLRILLCLALSILLICCANVANLVRARNEHRAPEFALRRALGAGRSRLIRQVVVEGVLLTGAGACGAMLLAPVAGRWLMRLVGTPDLALDLTPDLSIGIFASCLVVASALAIFLWPAWQLVTASHELTSARVSRRLRAGKIIVASQVATVMVLLVVTGLALVMLRRLDAVPLGFDPTSVWSVELSFSKQRSTSERTATLERLRRALQDSEGVDVVSYAYPMVYGVGGWSMGIVPEGYVPAPGEDTEVGVLAVGPGFFATLRVPIEQGRVFESADAAGSSNGVVVNAAFARRYFPNRTALGQSIRMPAPVPGIRQIIGVVGDVRHYGVRSEPWPMVYQPGPNPASSLLVRVSDARAPLAVLTSAVEAEGDAQIDAVRPLSEAVAVLVGRERMLARLSTTVAAVTLLLAALGLYGLVAFAVSCRRAEFGIRLALGALPADVRRLVIREAAVVVAVGVGTGLALSSLASRLLGGVIHDAPPLELPTLIAAIVCMTAVALVAAWLPAWRAGRTDPTTTLRDG